MQIKPYPKDTRYLISDEGDVIGQKGKPIKGGYSQGYRLVFVTNTMEKVSRLVAITFVHNPDPIKYNVVNHINGIKSDDRATNLEWCDRAHNMKHAKETGLFLTNTGINHYLAKLDEVQVRTIKQCFKDGLTNRQLGNYFKVDRQTIRSIREGKSWVRV